MTNAAPLAKLPSLGLLGALGMSEVSC